MGDAYDAMEATDPKAYERRLREAKDTEISSLRAALEEARGELESMQGDLVAEIAAKTWANAQLSSARAALEEAQAKITAAKFFVTKHSHDWQEEDGTPGSYEVFGHDVNASDLLAILEGENK